MPAQVGLTGGAASGGMPFLAPHKWDPVDSQSCLVSVIQVTDFLTLRSVQD